MSTMMNGETRRAWQFGPSLLDDGTVRFRLWAPDIAEKAGTVHLALTGSDLIPMAAQAGGWYEVMAPAQAGTQYMFRLEDGATFPDPASRAQAGDVHTPSIVVDPHTYVWQHTQWRGRPWQEAVIYEMHVGVLGGFAAAAGHLPRLARMGITAIELMPLAEFPGARNWGYDGVLPFAPECSYGTPDALRAFVDAAHGLGMMVLLDVVYNHFGPEGNLWPRLASGMFRHDIATSWGAAIDFRQREVRRFFTENVLYWLEDFRFDGLRLDAVHAIEDNGWLREMLHAVQDGMGHERQIHLILENDHNDATLLRDGFTAQWNDDFHHALHVLLTKETHGYYGDYADACGAPIDHLGKILAEGFAYQGQFSPHRDGARGTPSTALPPTAFVSFLQNHDQIGNRAHGERLMQLADPHAVRCAAALHCLAPQIPLLFMGEECGSDTPFPYFTDHPPELAEAVRVGRQREFAGMAGFAADDAPHDVTSLPDPNAPETFASACPSFADNPWAAWYTHVLNMRHERIVPLLSHVQRGTATRLSDHALHVAWPLRDGGTLRLWVNLDTQAADIPITRAGTLLFATDVIAIESFGMGRLMGYSVLVMLETSEAS